MAYKLAIADKIGVKVEGKYCDETGASRPFKFVLVCERLSAQAMQDAISDKQETVVAFFEKYARDWQGQKLVLEEDDTPAAFGVEALKCLLGITGMAMTCWQAYVTQVAVAAKN